MFTSDDICVVTLARVVPRTALGEFANLAY
jgi:hypothetical protein